MSTGVVAGDPLARWALEAPDRPAVIMDRAGTVTTYRELHERSLRLAHQLRAWGLRRGDGIAIVAENRREYLEIAWAAQRSGLYYTAVNWHLQSAEIAYIVDDCGAAVVFTSAMLADAVDAIAADTPNVRHVVNLDRPTPERRRRPRPRVDRAARRRVRGMRAAVLLRHDRAAEGGQATAAASGRGARQPPLRHRDVPRPLRRDRPIPSTSPRRRCTTRRR